MKRYKKSVRTYRNQYLLFLSLFIISRLLVIHTGPVFFDSPEYIERLSNPNFLEAVARGHLPLHSGYILILWPFFQIGNLINAGALLSILIQIVCATIAVICFFRIARRMFDESIALLASALLSFNPVFWISNVTFMMEGLYIPLFIISLYFIYEGSIQNRSSYKYLTVGAISYVLSFLTHFGIILWAPLLIVLTAIYNKRRVVQTTVVVVLSIGIGSFITAYFISIYHSLNLTDSLAYLYTGKLAERGIVEWNTHSILSMIRTIIIPILRNNTIVVTFISLIGLVLLSIKNKKLLLLFFIWIIPVVIANQWWDSLFFGRHGLAVTAAFSMLTAYVVVRHKMAIYALFIYLFITVIPALLLLRGPIPYIELTRNITHLKPNGLYIESHFARPQTERMYNGQTIYVDEPGWSKANTYRMIMDTIIDSRPVYISSQALSEPYGLYTGPYIHTLSLSYANPYVLQDITDEFTLKKLYRIKLTDIDMYQVTSYSPSHYPQIPSLKFDRRRIDYTDPVIQILRSAYQLFGKNR